MRILFFFVVAVCLRVVSARRLPTRKISSSLNSRGPRRIISILSLAGASETAYLSLNHATLSSGSPLSSHFYSLCGHGECSSVLSSPYATIPLLDIPLSTVGFCGYALLFLLSFIPLLHNGKRTQGLEFNSAAILSISGTMGVFSLYLMYLLTAVLQEYCAFCYTSAGLSISIALVAWVSKLSQPPVSSKRAIGMATTSAGTIVASLLFAANTLFVPFPSYASITPPGIREKMEENVFYEPPPIKTKSTKQAIEVAEKIKSLDGQMYGAYWCSHCNNQKQVLGQEAMKIIGYIECDKEGLNSQNDLCMDKKVPGYPTWIIDGQKYPGKQYVYGYLQPTFHNLSYFCFFSEH